MKYGNTIYRYFYSYIQTNFIKTTIQVSKQSYCVRILDNKQLKSVVSRMFFWVILECQNMYMSVIVFHK